MSKKIKGISIEIGGDTKGLDKALDGVNKKSRSLQSELKEVQGALKFNPNSVELLAQKQTLLTDAISTTSGKLKTLKEAQAQVQRQFEQGEISGEQYRAFQREVLKTESILGGLENQMRSMQESQQKTADATQELNKVFERSGKTVNDFASVIGQNMVRAISEGKASASQLEKALGQINKELEKTNKSSKTTAQELKELEAALKLDPGNVTLLAQNFDVLQQAIAETEKDLQSLKEKQAEVEQQFANGEIDTGEYREFQREIEKTENKLRGYRTSVSQMQADQQKAAEATRNLAKVFDLSGQSIEDFTDVIGQDMVRAIQEGRASAGQLETALEQIGRSVTGTETDVNQLSDALRRLDDNGSINDLRQDLQTLGNEAAQADDKVDKLGDSLKGLAGAAAGIVGLGAIIHEALNADDLNAKIDVTFDVSEESKNTVRQVLADLKSYGVEGEEALEGMRRQFALNKDASVDMNTEIVKGAAAIAKSYAGVDFVELIQEVNEVAGELEVTDKAALNLVNSLLKIGFPVEQIDIIAEYGGQLKRAGFELKEIQGIMAAAAATDSWNIDILLDGLKEGRIKAAEMARGLTNDMRDAVKEATGNVSQYSDEQIAVMADGFAAQEKALSKTLSNRENAISKSHDKQKKALDKSLSAEYDATQKALSKLENDRSKALDKQYQEVSKSYEKQYQEVAKSYDKQYEEASKTYSKQLNELGKALDQELTEYQKASDAKIALIDKEYTEKLKLIDEEKYKKIKAIEDEIKGINSAQEAEDKKQQKIENNRKRAELTEKVRTAKDAETKKAAVQALKDFEEKLRLQKEKEQRKAQIDELKDKKDVINETSNEQKEAIKGEYDEKKQQAKDLIDSERDLIKERQEAEKQAMSETNAERLKSLKESQTNDLALLKEKQTTELSLIKERQSAELTALKETNAQKLTALREEQTNRKDALNERLSAEQSAIREAHAAELESFKKMNDQKLAWAKEPPDSAAFKAVEDQLLAWGDAIAVGDEQGSKAFKEMVAWLDEMEEGALKNAVGVGLFGTMWEEQGDNIVESIMNAEDALAELQKMQGDVNDDLGRYDETGLKQFLSAIENLKVALDPVFKIIADIIGAIAKFAAEHPKMTAFIAVVVAGIGLVVAALLLIAPIVTAVMSVVAALGTGFVAIAAGPIAIVIAAIVAIIAIVAVLIAAWEPLTKFFKGLWDGIVSIFKSVVGWFTKDLPKLLSKAMEACIGAIKAVWKPLSKFFSDFWAGTVKVFKNSLKFFTDDVPKIFTKVVDGIINAFKKLPKGLENIFKGLVNILKIPINNMIKMLNLFLQGLNKIKIPDWVPKVGGKGFSIPEIPMLEKGTNYFKGGKAIVGEKGPELVEMPTGAKVHNADKTANMLGNTQQPITVPITLEIDGAVLAKKTVKYTDRELQNRSANKRRGGGLS